MSGFLPITCIGEKNIDFIIIFQLFPSINSYHSEVFVMAHK